jgi:hypothetical protein
MDAAIAIKKETSDLVRGEYLGGLKDLIGGIDCRMALTYGSVLLTCVGCKQLNSMSIFGKPLNLAVNMVQEVDRGCGSVIVIDEKMHHILMDSIKMKFKKLDNSGFHKSIKYTDHIYKLEE